MGNRPWVFGAVALLLLARGEAQSQPIGYPTPTQLLPTTRDAFTDPFFNPTTLSEASTRAAEWLPQRGPYFDITTASDPFLPSNGVSVPPHPISVCDCCPDFTTWFTAEWIIGRTSGPSLEPVITTGPAAAGPLAGTIGQPTSLPLFGGKRMLNNWRSGLRVEAGIWFDDEHQTGASARLYSLFSTSERLSFQPNGISVVDVPQFVPIRPTAVQVPVFIGFPGKMTGDVTASVGTSFTGGDLNLRRLLDRGNHYNVELLAGYRELYLGDQFDSSFTAIPIGPNTLTTPQRAGVDRVHTQNNFYGPQLGLAASTSWNRFTLDAHATSALGVTASHMDFTHARTITGGAMGDPTVIATLGSGGGTSALTAINSGLLTQASSNGTLTYFGVVAEAGMKVNWRATDHLRLTAGYSFLYWNNVRRAQEMFTGGSILRPGAIDFVTYLFSVGLDMRF